MFSVIIPTYNSSSYINKALDSILEQTINKENIEIIIVDDNSNDIENLINVLSFYRHSLNVELIINDVKGNASISRNIGIKKARFDIICLLDADDYWSNNKLESGIKLLINNNVVYSKLHRGTNEQVNNNTYSIIPQQAKKNTESLGEYLFENKGIIQTSSLMYKKSDFKNVFFNEKLNRHQDYDFCLKLESQNAVFTMDYESITYWIILNEKTNAVDKGANINFCVNWLKEYSIYLTERSENYYIGKNMFLISIKEKSIFYWLRFSLSLGFFRCLKIFKISISVIFSKLISKVL
ncbi:glycosyltransferase family 2 protein [Aliivibrio logei]|uniref:Glycosyltransferase 2-like domain-containing protein n=1 Tax=Aliivibrio logei 5S-186 TaxID=626086 RepID=A0ABX3ASZ9_ALILO|nr:glycosyltransferase family 2 protein [Aliivibrio logei]OEF10075.1 hypothetical protein A1Q5_14055 [Aliivibrio logei 5S-186]